jgi:hypothetical protein
MFASNHIYPHRDILRAHRSIQRRERAIPPALTRSTPGLSTSDRLINNKALTHASDRSTHCDISLSFSVNLGKTPKDRVGSRRRPVALLELALHYLVLMYKVASPYLST